MRTHTEIVDAIGAEKLATLFGLPLSTTRSRSRRNSIPAEFWLGFRARRWAKYDELAQTAAEARGRIDVILPAKPTRKSQAVTR